MSNGINAINNSQNIIIFEEIEAENINLKELPTEIICHIASYLTVEDRLSLASISKVFFNAVFDPYTAHEFVIEALSSRFRIPASFFSKISNNETPEAFFKKALRDARLFVGASLLPDEDIYTDFTKFCNELSENLLIFYILTIPNYYHHQLENGFTFESVDNWFEKIAQEPTHPFHKRTGNAPLYTLDVPSNTPLKLTMVPPQILHLRERVEIDLRGHHLENVPQLFRYTHCQMIYLKLGDNRIKLYPNIFARTYLVNAEQNGVVTKEYPKGTYVNQGSLPWNSKRPAFEAIAENLRYN
ncbi:MAG: F-box protein [Chlamydiota bacterium]